MAETTTVQTTRKTLIETIAEYLTNDDWKFDREEKGKAIQVYVRGDRATYRMRFVTDEECSLLTFVLHGPTQVPDELRPEVLELLNIMNVRYMIGNFEAERGPQRSELPRGLRPRRRHPLGPDDP